MNDNDRWTIHNRSITMHGWKIDRLWSMVDLLYIMQDMILWWWGFLKYHHTESYISVLQEYVLLMPKQCPSHGDAGFSSWTCQRAAVFDHHNWRRRWVDGDHYCSWFSCWWFRKHLHVMFKLSSRSFCCCLPPGIEGIVNNNSALQSVCYNYLCRQELQEHPRRRQNTTARDLFTGSV